jgi:threonine aldolase
MQRPWGVELDVREVQALAAQCEFFLSGHGVRTVRQRLEDIANSPYALQKNDHYGRGGFVTEFERTIADLLGKEAAVFMPSGTMAQPIALRVWADLCGIQNVAFHPTCHLELHEFKAYRELHHLHGILLGEPDRLFTLADLNSVAEPLSTVLIELPQREIGGQLPKWEDLIDICHAVRARGAKLHLDGARLWECGPFYGRSYADIVAPFDSVYVSFYKILDGLPGAALAGPASLIESARVWQRRQGGNLQQQSPSAISAQLGLDTHLPRIPDYVAKAAEVALALSANPSIAVTPEKPPTNMMHLRLVGDRDRLLSASYRVMAEDKVGLFFYLDESGKTEISIGNGCVGLEARRVAELFDKVFSLAQDWF